MRLNSVSFSEIGMSAPLQNAHPTGAKFPANILISPINGLDMKLPPRRLHSSEESPDDLQSKLGYSSMSLIRTQDISWASSTWHGKRKVSPSLRRQDGFPAHP